MVMLQHKNLSAGITELRETIRLKPDFTDAFLSLGTALQQAGSLPEAIEEFQRAVKLAPASVEPHLRLAGAYRLKRYWSAASTEYEAALRLEPTIRKRTTVGGVCCWNKTNSMPVSANCAAR